MRGNVILTGEIKNICKSLIGKSERKKRPGTSKHIRKEKFIYRVLHGAKTHKNITKIYHNKMISGNIDWIHLAQNTNHCQVVMSCPVE